MTYEKKRNRRNENIRNMKWRNLEEMAKMKTSVETENQWKNEENNTIWRHGRNYKNKIQWKLIREQ